MYPKNVAIDLTIYTDLSDGHPFQSRPRSMTLAVHTVIRANKLKDHIARAEI